MELSLSRFGLKGVGAAAVLFVGGFCLYKFTDQSDLGLFTLISAIVIGIILGVIEIAERIKKLNNPFE